MNGTTCQEVVDKVTAGDDVDWTQLTNDIDQVISTDIDRLFESLYAWDYLKRFHDALFSSCVASVAAATATLESISCYNTSRLLMRYLELAYGLSTPLASWTLDCNDTSVAELILGEAFQTPEPGTAIPAPTPSPSAMCNTIATHSSESSSNGIATLTRVGGWIGAQLVAAQKTSAISSEQFKIGTKLIELNLPAIAVDTVEWLAQGLHTGVCSKDPSSIARLHVLAEFVVSAKSDGSLDMTVEQPIQERLAGLMFRVIQLLSQFALRANLDHLEESKKSLVLEAEENDASLAAMSVLPSSVGQRGLAALKTALYSVDSMQVICVAARQCGPCWFLRAVSQLIIQSASLDYMLRLADVCVMVVVAIDGADLARSGRTLFAQILPQVCRQIQICAQGVALARLALQLAAILLENHSSSLGAVAPSDAADADTTDTVEPKTKMRKLSRTTEVTKPAAMGRPIAEMALLMQDMVDLLHGAPAAALSFPALICRTSQGAIRAVRARELLLAAYRCYGVPLGLCCSVLCVYESASASFFFV